MTALAVDVRKAGYYVSCRRAERTRFRLWHFPQYSYLCGMKALSAYRPALFLLAALVLLSAASCSDRSARIVTALSAADSLMLTDPRAALDILNRLDSTVIRKMGSRDKAFYTLLRTEAKYKCWLPVAEDTAIFEVTEYYRRRGPKARMARALMMLGAVLSERGDADRAMAVYKEAEPIIERRGDREQLGLIHTRIGELYHTTYTDVGNAVHYYRSALEDFEEAGAEYRLASANLALSRMLLKDSADTGQEFFIKGTAYARLYADTINLIESVNQEVQYLFLHQKAYLKAARISRHMLDNDCRKWLTKPVLNSFCQIAAEGYLQAGQPDSADFCLDRMIVTDVVDSLLVHSIMRKAAETTGNMDKYLENDRRISEITQTLKSKAAQHALKNTETAVEFRYAILEAKYRTMLAISAAAVLLLITLLAILLVIKYRKSTASMKAHINKGTDAINILIGADIENSEVDDLKRFSEAIERITKKRRESLEKTARISVEMMDVIDSTMSSFRRYTNPETFQRQIGVSLEKHRSTILKDAEDIVETVYPGFVERLAHESGNLTRKDRLIITLTLCGFSTDSICWLTGIGTGSLTVYRSNINKKMGWSGKLSDNLFRIISENFH